MNHADVHKLTDRTENVSDLSQSRFSNKRSKVGRVGSVRFQMSTDVLHLLPPVTFNDIT